MREHTQLAQSSPPLTFRQLAPPLTVKENDKYNFGRGKYRNIIFFFTNFPQSAGKSA